MRTLGIVIVLTGIGSLVGQVASPSGALGTGDPQHVKIAGFFFSIVLMLIGAAMSQKRKAGCSE